MNTLQTLIIAVSLTGMCWISPTASAQSFDLGAAIDKKRTNTNSKRTRLNKALSPFYNGRLTTATVQKPELKVDGDEVKVIYPVQLTINGAKYKAAIAQLMKVLDAIGKRASNPIADACKGQGCKEEKFRENNVGRLIRSYNLRNLHGDAPKDHMRIYVNTGIKPGTIRAWDVPKANIDIRTLEKHLLARHAPMKLTVQLGTGDFNAPRQPGGERIGILASQTVEVGISRKTNRAVNGATMWSDFVFINPVPHFRGNFNAQWDLNRTDRVRVSFSLTSDKARKVKGARAIVRPKHHYRGTTQTVR